MDGGRVTLESAALVTPLDVVVGAAVGAAIGSAVDLLVGVPACSRRVVGPGVRSRASLPHRGV